MEQEFKLQLKHILIGAVITLGLFCGYLGYKVYQVDKQTKVNDQNIKTIVDFINSQINGRSTPTQNP